MLSTLRFVRRFADLDRALLLEKGKKRATFAYLKRTSRGRLGRSWCLRRYGDASSRFDFDRFAVGDRRIAPGMFGTRSFPDVAVSLSSRAHEVRLTAVGQIVVG